MAGAVAHNRRTDAAVVPSARFRRPCACCCCGRLVSAVACGYAHSLALCENFEVLSWGSGWKGKLGLGDDHNRLTPTLIPSLKRKHLKQIVAGSFHTLDLENRKLPTPLLGLQGIEVGCVAAGETHSLCSSRDGSRAWAWGGCVYGQLGVGGREQRLSPQPVEDLENKHVTQARYAH